ncbi:MAG: DUF1015 domain-containing protein [Candidatus Omnitrophica bacterium]|nr:DUF1015 domain-containing protein [Candidatus Omnitrophota bacterium]MDD5356448.1 DUF1015 domain-containing protein [Candidatus Omnitrophota bacterium]
MANIRGFRGVCYSPDKIMDLSTAVCPPYDVINKQEQDYYYRESPYNFIRLILNKSEEADNNTNNKYTRANLFFNEWLKTGILKQDNKETIYFYKQDYLCGNKELSRIGFIALLNISDSTIVFPHENTHTAPKMDRLELVKNVKANLSPIFTIFSDKGSVVENIFNKYLSRRKPDFALKDVEGIRNSVWRLTDEDKIAQILRKMKETKIFIADGHHRFEVSLMYLNLMRKEDKAYSADKSYNCIMTYFTPMEAEGLYVMPIHRIVKLQIGLDRLKDIFKIHKVDSVSVLEEKLKKSPKSKCVFGLYYDKDYYLLELKDKQPSDNYFKQKKCFKGLDVAVLDFYIFAQLLKIKKEDIVYTKDIYEIKNLADNDSKSAFILRPINVEQIRDVALCGEKMPPKSTYFYPKLLSGLVAHKFE